MACRSRGGRLRPGVRAGWQSRRARRSEPDWHAPCHCGWQPIASVKALQFRLFPTISNQFQSIPITFYKIMKRLLGDFRYAIDDLRGFGGAGVKPVAMPQSAGCAGRQGHSATLSTSQVQSRLGRDGGHSRKVEDRQKLQKSGGRRRNLTFASPDFLT